jgi:hypothetical protein
LDHWFVDADRRIFGDVLLAFGKLPCTCNLGLDLHPISRHSQQKETGGMTRK